MAGFQGYSRKLAVAAFFAIGIAAVPAWAGSYLKTSGNAVEEFGAQRRPQVTIHPRRQPGPNAKRYCEAWLTKEYSVSGTVVVPKMRCVWR